MSLTQALTAAARLIVGLGAVFFTFCGVLLGWAAGAVLLTTASHFRQRGE